MKVDVLLSLKMLYGCSRNLRKYKLFIPMLYANIFYYFRFIPARIKASDSCFVTMTYLDLFFKSTIRLVVEFLSFFSMI
jgi:hypothetical protein